MDVNEKCSNKKAPHKSDIFRTLMWNPFQFYTQLLCFFSVQFCPKIRLARALCVEHTDDSVVSSLWLACVLGAFFLLITSSMRFQRCFILKLVRRLVTEKTHCCFEVFFNWHAYSLTMYKYHCIIIKQKILMGLERIF